MQEAKMFNLKATFLLNSSSFQYWLKKGDTFNNFSENSF